MLQLLVTRNPKYMIRVRLCFSIPRKTNKFLPNAGHPWYLKTTLNSGQSHFSKNVKQLVFNQIVNKKIKELLRCCKSVDKEFNQYLNL